MIFKRGIFAGALALMSLESFALVSPDLGQCPAVVIMNGSNSFPLASDAMIRGYADRLSDAFKAACPTTSVTILDSFNPSALRDAIDGYHQSLDTYSNLMLIVGGHGEVNGQGVYTLTDASFSVPFTKENIFKDVAQDATAQLALFTCFSGNIGDSWSSTPTFGASSKDQWGNLTYYLGWMDHVASGAISAPQNMKELYRGYQDYRSSLMLRGGTLTSHAVPITIDRFFDTELNQQWRNFWEKSPHVALLKPALSATQEIIPSFVPESYWYQDQNKSLGARESTLGSHGTLYSGIFHMGQIFTNIVTSLYIVHGGIYGKILSPLMSK